MCCIHGLNPQCLHVLYFLRTDCDKSLMWSCLSFPIPYCLCMNFLYIVSQVLLPLEHYLPCYSMVLTFWFTGCVLCVAGYKVSDTMRKGILQVNVYNDAEYELLLGMFAALSE